MKRSHIARMEKILDCLPEMQFVVDRRGTLQYLKFARGHKGSFDPAASLGKPVETILDPSIAPVIGKKIREVFESGSDNICEYSLKLPSWPEPMHFQARMALLDDEEVLVSVRDMTARVAAQKELAESELRYRSLFESSPLPMLILDSQTLRFLDVNEAAVSQYGYTKEEFLSLAPDDIFQGEERGGKRKAVKPGIPCEELTGVWQHRKKDGAVIQVEVFCHRITFEGRSARIVLCHDVTLQKKADLALAESEEKFRSAFHTSPDAITISTYEDGVLLEVNKGFLDLTGYSRDEVLGRSVKDLRIWAGPRDRSDYLRKMEKEGVLKDFEMVLRKKNGSEKAVLLTGSRITLDGKQCLLTVARDVTGIREARQAVEVSEKKFRTAFMASPDAITISRLKDGVFCDVNDSFVNLSGFGKEEVLGKSSLEINLWMDPEDRALLEGPVREKGFADNVEIRFRAKDGRIIYGLVSSSLIILEEVPHILTITRDITPIRKAQEAAKESEERFHVIFDTSPDAIVILDSETRRIVDVNHGFVVRSGYSKGEVTGRNTEEIGLWGDPLEKENFYRVLDRTGMVDGLECRFLLRDGSTEKGLVSARPLELEGRPHLLVTVRDVSSLLETQRRLRASVAEKEVLLREVHHRVKNNLQVILGLLNLQEHHLTDQQGKMVFKESRNRILTMSLIHEVLYQSRDLARINFKDYLRGLTDNLFSSFGVSRERVFLELEVEDAQVVVDTAIPCGLIVNELITNALKHAFPGGRKGTIKVIFRRRKPQGYHLAVSDDGIGIPPELDVSRTHTLGLQLVHVLLDQLRGRIEVDLAAGTAFRMDFEEYHEAGAMLY